MKNSKFPLHDIIGCMVECVVDIDCTTYFTFFTPSLDNDLPE